MNSENPKKKVDFFNRGRGVNLSQFESNGYQDESNPDLPEIIVEDCNDSEYGHPSYCQESDELDTSMSPTSVNQYPSHDPHAISPPPNSPIPPHYPNSPTAYYPPYHPSDHPDTSLNYLPYGAAPHLSNGYQHHPLPPMPPHIPGPIPGPYPGPSVYTEPTFANSFVSHSEYSPLRSIDPNGFHGMGMPNLDTDGHGGNMPYEDPPGGAGAAGSKKKKRQRKCRLCYNHGIQVGFKGQKWFCPYRNCECDSCTITRGRQHHEKEQQKLTRHLLRLHQKKEDIVFNPISFCWKKLIELTKLFF